MNASKRFFRYAIGGSLMLHLAVAFVVRMHPVEAAPDQPPRKIDVIHIASTPTPPPPKLQTPPPSKPQPARRRSAKPPAISHHSSVHGTRTVAFATPAPGIDTGGGPGVDPVVTVEPSAQPTVIYPATSPAPACTAPDVPARTIEAVTPEAPQSALQEGMTGVADVRVDLAANGDVLAVSIYRSSGSLALDQAALRAARSSRYAAALQDCRPAAGSYIFKAEFDS